MIKNATRLKNVHDWLGKKKKRRERGREIKRKREKRGRRGKKTLAIYFLCVLLPERQSADQQFV